MWSLFDVRVGLCFWLLRPPGRGPDLLAVTIHLCISATSACKRATCLQVRTMVPFRPLASLSQPVPVMNESAGVGWPPLTCSRFEQKCLPASLVLPRSGIAAGFRQGLRVRTCADAVTRPSSGRGRLLWPLVSISGALPSVGWEGRSVPNLTFRPATGERKEEAEGTLLTA